jgi:hypothetical protein
MRAHRVSGLSRITRRLSCQTAENNNHNGTVGNDGDKHAAGGCAGRCRKQANGQRDNCFSSGLVARSVRSIHFANMLRRSSALCAFLSPTRMLSLASVYASIAVTLLMRPIGSAISGHYADVRGRKGAMLLAIVGVGVRPCGLSAT